MWIVEEICCVSRAHEDKLLDGKICQIPVVEDGGLAILYWRNPWCSLLVEKFLLLRSFVWNAFSVEMDTNGKDMSPDISQSDNSNNIYFYIGILGCNVKWPGNAVECCHGQVCQSEVEQEAVGGCPHSTRKLSYQHQFSLSQCIPYPRKCLCNIPGRENNKSRFTKMDLSLILSRANNNIDTMYYNQNNTTSPKTNQSLIMIQ